MISRDREVLGDWASSVLSARQEAYEEKKQQLENQLKDRLGGTVDEWVKRQDKDVEYLKQEGAWQVFKDAERILKSLFPPPYANVPYVHVGIVKPKQEDLIINAYLELLWEIDSVPSSRNWVANQLLCFVAREEGIPVGFCLSGFNETIPNRTFLGRRLVEAIKTAPRITFAKKHW